jgi:hypothetical protein
LLEDLIAKSKIRLIPNIYQQHIRLLSGISHSHHNFQLPNPHRQLILDLQAWLKSILHENHKVILSIDTNETYDPDIIAPSQSLPPFSTSPIVDCKCDSKLGILIATCELSLDPEVATLFGREIGQSNGDILLTGDEPARIKVG